MKKKTWIVLIILLLVLFIPIPSGTYKDGGTRAYTALAYKIVKWKRLIDADGIYEKTRIYPFPQNFKSMSSLWYQEEQYTDKKSEVESEPVKSAEKTDTGEQVEMDEIGRAHV